MKALTAPSPAAIPASAASTVSTALRSPLRTEAERARKLSPGAHDALPSSGVNTAGGDDVLGQRERHQGRGDARQHREGAR